MNVRIWEGDFRTPYTRRHGWKIEDIETGDRYGIFETREQAMEFAEALNTENMKGVEK